MSKKSDYSKVFGGKSKHDTKIKKSKNQNIFGIEDSGKKKKKKKKSKPEKVEKVLRNMLKDEIADDTLSEFIIWEKINDPGIKSFNDISERCKGLFVLEVTINGDERALVPVTVTSNKEVLHAETHEPIEEVFAHYSTDGEITETDLAVAKDALSKAELVDAVYKIDTNKLMENINLFNIVDEE